MVDGILALAPGLWFVAPYHHLVATDFSEICTHVSNLHTHLIIAFSGISQKPTKGDRVGNAAEMNRMAEMD